MKLDTVICGDCLEFMRGMDDNSVDLVLTDPPYGINIAKHGSLSGGNVPYVASNWDAEPPPVVYFDEMLRVSKNQIIWGGNYFPSLWKNPCRGFIYWNKLNHHKNRSAGELAWTSFDMCSRHFEYMWDGNRYGFPNDKIQGVGKPTTRTHPTEKPVALMVWLLKEFSLEGEVILDCFMGSGSVPVACVDLGRHFLGIEINPDYCKIAEKRIQEERDKYALFPEKKT